MKNYDIAAIFTPGEIYTISDIDYAYLGRTAQLGHRFVELSPNIPYAAEMRRYSDNRLTITLNAGSFISDGKKIIIYSGSEMLSENRELTEKEIANLLHAEKKRKQCNV